MRRARRRAAALVGIRFPEALPIGGRGALRFAMLRPSGEPEIPIMNTPTHERDAPDGNAVTADPAKASRDEPRDGACGDDVPRPTEIGGQAGPEPTRYGDWEKKGRCTDF